MARIKCVIFLLLISVTACKEKFTKKNQVNNIKEQDALFTKVKLETLPKPNVLPMRPTLVKKVGPTQIIKMPEMGVKVNPAQTALNQNKINSQKKTSFSLSEIKIKSSAPQSNTAKPPNFPDYNPLNFNIYDLTSGLIDSKIHGILQDKKGNLWFTSYLGASKYNGRTYENFTTNQGLGDGYIDYAYEDRAGNIWFSHRKGISKFDGENMVNFHTPENVLAKGINQFIEDQDGDFWLASEFDGVYKIEKDKPNKLIKFNEIKGPVNALIEDKIGNIWFATETAGLIKYDGKSFIQIAETSGSAISCLTESSDGSLWFGSMALISRIDGKTLTTYNNLGYSKLKNILEDDSKAIWFTTEFDGAFLLKDKLLKNITTKEGLPSDETSGLLQDRAGNIWIGTYEGAVKYNKMFSSFFAQDGLTSQAARSLYQEENGNIWVGCDLGGVSYFNYVNNTITNFTVKSGLSGQNINSITVDLDGDVWFGFWDSDLCKLSADHKTITQYKNAGYSLVSLFTDHQGDIWYSSREKEGVFKIEKKKNRRTHYTINQGLVDSEIIQIKQDIDTNYVFTTFAGVSFLNKEQTELTNYPKTESQNLGIIESYSQDHTGAYWLSSLAGEGIFRLNKATNKLRQFTMNDGLPSNIALSTIQDNNKNMWISTRNGLAKIDKATLDSLHTKSSSIDKNLFTVFGSENNFIGNGDGRHYILKDKFNRLWVLLLDRITFIDLNEVQENETSVEIELLNFKLFNETINWTTERAYTLKNGLEVGSFEFNGFINTTGIPFEPVLPYNNNFVSFEFVGIDVNKPQSVKYQYQLEGLENNWSSITNTPETTYGNLSPGEYTFKVKAMNEAGVWSSIYQYQFSITPPWWKTWWAYLFYISSALLLIYAWTRYNVYLTLEKYKATQAMRAKISTDLHDDVGSILSGLSMKSELMSYSADETQQKELTTLSEMSRDAMERMRDTVWAMDARKDKYENLTDRMRSFAENNLTLKNISYDFKIESLKNGEFINPEVRQNVYLIFKEAITNILKHSDANHVSINFNKGASSLSLKIKDDGSQKDAKPTDGLGMSNMKARAETLQGTLKAYYKNGFIIDVEIPTK